MHLKPEKISIWMFKAIMQHILAIAPELTCDPTYTRGAALKNCFDFVCLAYQSVRNTDTKNIRNSLSEYTLRTCNIGKQSWCLHLVKVQPERRSWSTGRRLPLLDTYDQGVLEWCFSGKIHMRGPDAETVPRDSHRHNRWEVPLHPEVFSRFRTVTPVWIHVWWWNDAKSLMLLRRGAYCYSSLSVKFQGHTAKKNRWFWPKSSVSGL